MWFVLHGFFALLWCFLTVASIGELVIGLLIGGVIVLLIARIFDVHYERSLVALLHLLSLYVLYIPISSVRSLLHIDAAHLGPQTFIYTIHPATRQLLWLFVTTIALTTQARAQVKNKKKGELQLTLYAPDVHRQATEVFIRKHIEHKCVMPLAGHYYEST